MKKNQQNKQCHICTINVFTDAFFLLKKSAYNVILGPDSWSCVAQKVAKHKRKYAYHTKITSQNTMKQFVTGILLIFV